MWRSLTLLQAGQGIWGICNPILSSFESIISHKRCRNILSCQHNTKGKKKKTHKENKLWLQVYE